MINRQNSPLFAQGKSKWDEFVAKYSGPYDFSQSVYAGMNQKVEFVCHVHGKVRMDAKNLMNGKECQLCAFAARKGKTRITKKKMLEKFSAAHGGRYDYSRSDYRGQSTPVTIICKTHGEFQQKPEYHWNGAGCPACFELRRGASSRMTLEEVTTNVTNIFSGLLAIESTEYKNNTSSLALRCTKHDAACKSRYSLLRNGYNPCPQCNHMASKGEAQVFRFLQTFTDAVQRDRTILKPRELDIYLPEHKLALEYCGEFWHSFGDAASEKAGRRKHAEKYLACKEQGIRLITMWESEWLEHNYAVRRLLRNALGKSKGKLMARKCKLEKVTSAQARAFYDRYHPQGGAGSGEHYALLWKGKIVACMRFVHGANDRGAGAGNRVWTLGRYATRVTVAGAASRLFKAFVADMKPPVVKSFSDNRFFDGGMYETLGFALEADVAPDYSVWSPKLGIRPKSHYQRRLLPARLQEHGVDEAFDPATDSRTEAEMTYLMGARRLYDCGKKRWVWTAPADA